MKKTLLSLIAFTSLYSSEFSVNPSFQGYSGVINTPNAQVTKEGHAVLHLNNQFDNFLRKYDYDKEESSQEDYIVGFGLFSFMEVQGRLSESQGHHRDLSANFKLQLPYHHKYLPDIAIGMQDLGGAANNYDNQYIVLDKELWFVRASLGYGNSSAEKNGQERMNGIFGAVEVKATDWLYIMAENDSVENHAALRLEVPKEWISSFNLRATVAQNLTQSSTSVGITVDIPLYHDSQPVTQAYQEREVEQELEKEASQQEITQESEANIYDYKIAPITPSKNIIDSKKTLQDKLVDFGFENVRIGTNEETIYIEVENSIFDHTDLDAIGYVLGTLCFSELEYENYTLTLLKNSLKTISVSGNVSKFKSYLETPSITNEKQLSANLKFDRDFDDSGVIYGTKVNSSLFIPRVELSLGLTTAVGTEFGVFDYIAALRTNVYMNLYDGLVVSAMYEMPFANSSDFDEGGIYYKPYENRLENRLVNAMAHQTLHYENFLNTLSLGLYQTDYVGALDQANYTTTSGAHALKFRGGYFVNTTDENKADKEIYLTSYRYNYSPMDIYLEATYGKFWYGDVGAQVQFKRFFGETSVAFNYKNTSSNSIEEQFAGIEVSFPLTTRKLYKANYAQLKGKSDFTYTLQSTVNKEDGTNSLNHAYAVTPKTDLELDTHYLNRDRLSSGYIKEHLDRLREAYISYK